MSESPEDCFVVIATYNHPAEAHIAKTKLESEGVEAFVLDEHMASINWHYTLAIGGVRLQVSREDEKRAREILNQEFDWENEAQDIKKTWVSCPKCHSKEVVYARYHKEGVAKVISILITLLVMIPFVVLKRKWQCLSCGHTWKMKLLKQEERPFEE